MAQQKKTDKYYEAKEVQEEAVKILDEFKERFAHLNPAELRFFFKSGKNKLGKKHVNVRIIREPYTLLTNSTVMITVTDEFWAEEIGPARTKALLEGLLSIEYDKKTDKLKKRSFDVQTFQDILSGQFKKLLSPTKDLVLS
jgi:hypothetical protein